MPNPIGIGVNIKNGQNPNAHLDYWYGPYNDIYEAKTATQNTTDGMSGATEVHRYVGMTVGILDENGSITEYWFRDGIEDSDLIPKVPDITIPPTPTLDDLLGNIRIIKFHANGTHFPKERHL